MNESHTTLSPEYVSPEERIVRFILCPKHWDIEEDKLKPNFIHLRKEEPGVSCVRYDFLGGKEGTVVKGEEFAAIFNNRKKKVEQHLKGWGACTAQDITNLNPNVISFSIDNPREKPWHACIQFTLEGGIVRGIVRDAYILELFEMIEESVLKYEML